MSEIKDGAHADQDSVKLSVKTISIAGMEILSVLGSGGMSTVYKARQVAMDRIVAIKVLHKHLLGESSNLVRFNREARFSTLLDHPNIAALFSFGTTDDDQPYLVMEYCQGETLKERMDRPMSWEETRSIFEQICLGLTHAHRQGVVHRDLKPANVFLHSDAEGKMQVKLIDFGIAKLQTIEESDAQKLTRTGVVVGTPSYMSPEQCIGGEVDTRADIYALGCMLYHVIAGRPPFDGDSILEVAGKHVSEAPPLISDVSDIKVSEQLWNVLKCALEKQPEDRYQTADAMRTSLLDVGAEAVAAGSPAQRHRRRIKLPPLRKIATVLLIVLIPCVVLVSLAIAGLTSRHSTSFAEADRLLNSGNYEEATPLLLAARRETLSDEDATSLLADLSDLLYILKDDQPPPSRIHILDNTKDEFQKSAVTLSRMITEPTANHPSLFAVNQTRLAAANANSSGTQDFHLNGIQMRGLNPEDNEYFQGMINICRGQSKAKDERIRLFKKAIDHLQQAHRPDALLYAMNLLANEYGAIENNEEKQKLRHQMAELAPNVLPCNDRLSAEVLTDMANYFLDNNREDEARKYLARAGEIYSARAGSASKLTYYHETLARILMEKRDYVQALKEYEKCELLLQRVYKDQLYCELMDQMATCEMGLNDTLKAHMYWQRSLQRAQKISNKELRLYKQIDTYMALVACLRKDGNQNGALQVMKLVLPLMQERFAIDMRKQQWKDKTVSHAKAVNQSSQILFRSLCELGHPDEARRVMDEQLQVLLKTVPPCEPIIDTYISLSLVQPTLAERTNCLEKAKEAKAIEAGNR
jgi:serine/threonine protein kinase